MRLIDADRLKEVFRRNTVCDYADIIDNAPTVCDIEQIRDEIERKANSGQWSEAVIYGMQKAIAIIDKYIKNRQTAEWEKFGKNTYACTNCRRGVYSREKYCPECGSLMKMPLKGG